MPFVDRLIELIAVVLLGITTVGSAWCGYQASKWGIENSDLMQEASDQHVEGARLFGAAIQRVSYDSMTVAQYAEARQAGNERLARFYRTSLVRPQFLPTLDRWEAEVRAGRTPNGLAADPEYLAEQFADYQETVAAAEAATQAGQEASDNATGYVATTIMLAIALFFAGVTASFQYRPARIFLHHSHFGGHRRSRPRAWSTCPRYSPVGSTTTIVLEGHVDHRWTDTDLLRRPRTAGHQALDDL